jgi:GAF domain-containing protein
LHLAIARFLHLKMATTYPRPIKNVDSPGRNKQGNGFNLGALLESTQEPILILDARNGRVVDANQPALDLFSYPADSIRKKKIWQLSARKQGNGKTIERQISQKFDEALEGKASVFDWIYETRMGKEIHTRVLLTRVPTEGKNYLGAYITETDPGKSQNGSGSQAANTDQFAGLALAGAGIASSLELEQVLLVVAKQFTNLLDIPICIISEVEPNTGKLSTKLEFFNPQNTSTNGGIKKASLAIPLELTAVLSDMRPLQKRIDDPKLSSDERNALTRAKVKSLLALPLTAQNRNVGIVELQDIHSVRNFSDQEIYLAQTLSHQAAVAIENARLFSSTRRQVKELTALHQVATAATEATGEDGLIEYATEIIRENFYPDNFGVLLLESSSSALVIHRSYESDPKIKGRIIPVNQGVTGTVASTGVALRVGDVTNAENYLGYDTQTLSELCVPMKIGERVIGVINAESRELDHFNEDDERLLTTIAGQLASGIERLRNQDAERRRTKQLAVLNELTTKMSGVLDRQALFDIVVEGLHNHMGYFSSDISWVDEASQEYVMEAVSGASEAILRKRGYRQSFGVGLLGKAALTSSHVLVGNVHSDKHYYLIPGLEAITSELVIPIKIYKKVVALLNVESTELDAFDDYEVSALTTLAEQISIALESITLFESTHRQLQELTVLHAVANAAVSAKSEEELLERATEIIGASIYPDQFGFLMLADDGPYLHVNRSYRGTNDVNKLSPVPLSQGIAGKVAATGQPWRVDDVRKEPSYFRVSGSMRSELCVPILGKDNRVLGVINAESAKVAAFTDADMRLLTTIAGQMGTAIEKLRLYESERVQREQAETLREVAAILGGANDSSVVLELILEQLKRVVPLDSASIQIVKGDVLSIRAVAGTLSPEVIGYELPIAQDKFAHPLLYEHRTVLYEDISDHPDWMQAPGAVGVRSWIGAPLIVRGECIGVLTVDGYSARQFTEADAQLVSSFAHHAGIALENTRLVEELKESFTQTISALAGAIDVRDSYTGGHSQRLADLAVKTGLRLGCSDQELGDLRWAALLHDIGKIGVPDEILRKPSTLENKEVEIMQRHPEIGARLVEPVRNLARVAPIIRAHQERYDGTGYPDKLKGDEIPKIARIISVVDAYVAMTDERVYRKALSHEQALVELRRHSGTQFDPGIVDAFLVVLEEIHAGVTG